MAKIFAKLFFTMWPRKQKEAHTQEGTWLRCACLVATIIHTLLYLLCIAIVGFLPMLINIGNAAWAYSCYLTLRERELGVYFFLLIVGVVVDVLALFGDKDQGNVQVLGTLINIAAAVLLGLYVARAWYHFRHTGGLHGNGPSQNLLED